MRTNTPAKPVTRVYDGDTITVDVAGWLAIVGRAIGIRVRGVDTPELRAKCSQEKLGAIEARDYVRQLMADADVIELERINRGKYFRVVADVIVDGENLADLLIQAELGRPYDGGSRQGWCD